jgi:hypothetical protein
MFASDETNVLVFDTRYLKTIYQDSLMEVVLKGISCENKRKFLPFYITIVDCSVKRGSRKTQKFYNLL